MQPGTTTAVSRCAPRRPRCHPRRARAVRRRSPPTTPSRPPRPAPACARAASRSVGPTWHWPTRPQRRTPASARTLRPTVDHRQGEMPEHHQGQRLEAGHVDRTAPRRHGRRAADSGPHHPILAHAREHRCASSPAPARCRHPTPPSGRPGRRSHDRRDARRRPTFRHRPPDRPPPGQRRHGCREHAPGRR